MCVDVVSIYIVRTHIRTYTQTNEQRTEPYSRRRLRPLQRRPLEEAVDQPRPRQRQKERGGGGAGVGKEGVAEESLGGGAVVDGQGEEVEAGEGGDDLWVWVWVFV